MFDNLFYIIHWLLKDKAWFQNVIWYDLHVCGISVV